MQFRYEEFMIVSRKNFGTLLAMVCCMAIGFGASEAFAADSQEITLNTKDGVRLAITYYPSEKGKDAVPVVMLHDFKESRNVFHSLAESLQSPKSIGGSRAVITVDLRGHGESTVQRSRDGRTRSLEAARLRPADFQDMVAEDLEAVRRFLVEQNNKGELNLNSLCLIGSGMGASVATYWSAVDWAAPRLATLKQGQDVKALVLLSPEWGFKGLPLLKPIRQPGVREKVSFLIVYGAQMSKAKKDATNIHKNLAKYHPEPPRDKIKEFKDLFLVDLPTKLQGTALLTSGEFNLLTDIDAFIDARISDKHFPWVARNK